MPEERVTEVKAADVAAITASFEPEQENLFKKMNVVGMGVGTNVKGGEDTGEPCVKVLVSQKLPLDLLTEGDKIDPKVGSYNTDVEEVGELFAGHPFMSSRVPPESQEEVTPQPFMSTGQPEEEVTPQPFMATALTPRIRPVEGGFSVGHYRITAGTYATAVYDRSPYPGIPPRYYVLSNNHVLANSNNARIGDPILQPGPYDGGTYPGDMIARLSRFVPIRFDGTCNYVDAAVAEGPFHWLDREIYWIGFVKGVRREWPQIGEILQKTGRTTNYTTGRVRAINAIVNVNYGGGRVGRFCRQIVTANMSAGGDSGSLVLDLNENAVGLLFAGSSVATIMNHIVYVQALLAIRIV
ncbi:MAG: serine protease [Dehalococcoidia bacterium]